MPVLGALIWGFRRTPRQEWRLAVPFLGLLGGLVLAGVIADMGSIALGQSLEEASRTTKRMILGAAGLVEDGGEMLLASVTCALAIGTFSAFGRPDRGGTAVATHA